MVLGAVVLSAGAAMAVAFLGGEADQVVTAQPPESAETAEDPPAPTTAPPDTDEVDRRAPVGTNDGDSVATAAGGDEVVGDEVVGDEVVGGEVEVRSLFGTRRTIRRDRLREADRDLLDRIDSGPSRESRVDDR